MWAGGASRGKGSAGSPHIIGGNTLSGRCWAAFLLESFCWHLRGMCGRGGNHIAIELKRPTSKRTPLPNPLPFSRGEGEDPWAITTPQPVPGELEYARA